MASYSLLRCQRRGGLVAQVECVKMTDGGITTEEVGVGVSLAEGMQSFLRFGSSEGLGETLQVAKAPSTFTGFEVVAFGGRRKLVQNPLMGTENKKQKIKHLSLRDCLFF